MFAGVSRREPWFLWAERELPCSGTRAAADVEGTNACEILTGQDHRDSASHAGWEGLPFLSPQDLWM